MNIGQLVTFYSLSGKLGDELLCHSPLRGNLTAKVVNEQGHYIEDRVVLFNAQDENGQGGFCVVSRPIELSFFIPKVSWQENVEQLQ